jgi:hypothetical protein
LRRNREFDIDDHLDDSRLWEGRAQAASRFEMSCSQFDNVIGGLLEARFRRTERRQARFYIPAMWAVYAVRILGVEDYRVTEDQLTFLRREKGLSTRAKTTP